MANVRVSTAAQNAMCDALVDLIDNNQVSPSINGQITIFDGSQPADANTAVTTQTPLVTLTFGTEAFGDAANGVATAGPIASGTAVATGTATWARISNPGSPDTTVFDCDVSTTGAGTGTIQLNTTSIVQDGTVSISSFTVTHPDGT